MEPNKRTREEFEKQEQNSKDEISHLRDELLTKGRIIGALQKKIKKNEKTNEGENNKIIQINIEDNISEENLKLKKWKIQKKLKWNKDKIGHYKRSIEWMKNRLNKLKNIDKSILSIKNRNLIEGWRLKIIHYQTKLIKAEADQLNSNHKIEEFFELKKN